MKNTWIDILVSLIFLVIEKEVLSFHVLRKVVLIALVSVTFFTSPVQARIPEPDHIIYGTLTYNNQLATSSDTQLNVRFELLGTELASYQMGSEAIGDNYVLKIPMGVLVPRASSVAWAGETGQIYISTTGVNILADTIVVGDRGSVLELNIVGVGDTDLDGLPDAWEINNGLNPNSGSDATIDSDGDTLTNLQEFQYGTDPQDSDTDNDGYNDDVEISAGSDPTSDLSIPSVTIPVLSGWSFVLLVMLMLIAGLIFVPRSLRSNG